jgi:hypothetical protein
MMKRKSQRLEGELWYVGREVGESETWERGMEEEKNKKVGCGRGGGGRMRGGKREGLEKSGEAL